MRPEHLTSRTIETSFGEPSTLIRTEGSWNDDGDWVESEPVRTAIEISTQPVSGSDARVRKLLEEGERLEGMRIAKSLIRLVPLSQGTAGDILLYDGETWRVRNVKRWRTYDEALIVRQEEQPAATE